MDMLSKLDFVEMLQELMFEDHDKVLLPLLILRLKEKQIKGEKINSTFKKPKKNNQWEKSIFSQNYKKETIPKKTNKSTTKISRPIIITNESDCQRKNYESAFKALLDSKPKQGVKAEVRNLMIENLNPIFQSLKQPEQEKINRNRSGMTPRSNKAFQFDEKEPHGEVMITTEDDAHQFADPIPSSQRLLVLDSRREKRSRRKNFDEKKRSSKKKNNKWPTKLRMRAMKNGKKRNIRQAQSRSLKI